MLNPDRIDNPVLAYHATRELYHGVQVISQCERDSIFEKSP